MIDQTLLPERFKIIRIRDAEAMWDAILRLAVRGAPAIGVAAAYGLVLSLRAADWASRKEFRRSLARGVDYLGSSRPTAVNLFWALERMRSRAEDLLAETDADLGTKAARRRLLGLLLEEAKAIHAEDRKLCDSIGRHGARLIRNGWRVLTHCNAGALATGGSGTALSVVYAACRAGKRVRVFADETRPLLQGSRLTAWELEKAGVEVTVICDGAAASVLRSGEVDCVVVGADRIAGNGDVANKIGTYGVAVLAREHRVPFYVAAPSTTFDLSLRSGAEIPIEERDAGEVVARVAKRGASGKVKVFNPAFDVTPSKYVTAIITEAGVITAPYRRSIQRSFGSARAGR